eukprot:gene17802-23410_t
MEDVSNMEESFSTSNDQSSVATFLSTEDGVVNKQVRKSCDGCAKAKKKCDGNMPCYCCKRWGIQCVYSHKLRPGPVPKHLRNADGKKTRTVAIVSDIGPDNSSIASIRSENGEWISIQGYDKNSEVSSMISSHNASFDESHSMMYLNHSSRTSAINSTSSSRRNSFSAISQQENPMLLHSPTHTIQPIAQPIYSEINLHDIMRLIPEILVSSQSIFKENELQMIHIHLEVGNRIIPILNKRILTVGIHGVLSLDPSTKQNSQVLASIALMWCSCGLGSAFLNSPQALVYASYAKEKIQECLDTKADLVIRAYLALEILYQQCYYLNLPMLLPGLSSLRYYIGMYSNIAENLIIQSPDNQISEVTKVLADTIKVWDIQFSKLTASSYISVMNQGTKDLMFLSPEFPSGSIIIPSLPGTNLDIDHVSSLSMDMIFLSALSTSGPSFQDPFHYVMLQLSIILHRIFLGQAILGLQELTVLGTLLYNNCKKIVYTSHAWHWIHLIVQMLFHSKLPDSDLQCLTISKELILQMNRLCRRSCYDEVTVSLGPSIDLSATTTSCNSNSSSSSSSRSDSTVGSYEKEYSVDLFSHIASKDIKRSVSQLDNSNPLFALADIACQQYDEFDTSDSKPRKKTQSQSTVSSPKNEISCNSMSPTVVANSSQPLAILLFNIIPYKAIAAETKKKLVKESKKAIATAIVTKRVPLWRKILEGANSMGGLKDWKVGDNRSEISALLNIASAILIFGGFFLLASLNLLRKEIKWESNYSKELKRVQEYKENMYFDAVQEIINKLADSKTKGSTKARLQNELKELDPKGIIQKYISEGGERPDISDIINQKPVKKKNSKKSSTNSTASETKIKSDSKTTSSNKKVDSNNDTVNSEKYLQVLDKLSDSLENEIPPQIKRKTRLSTISDEKKLNNALVKIEERIGDIEYWHLNGAARSDCDHWHDAAGIVNHHVALTLEVEQSLQTIDPSIALPYWEYAMDAFLYDNWQDSPVFNDDWFGDNSPTTEDHSLVTGRWADISTPTYESSGWSIADTGSLNPFRNARGQLRSPWNNNPSNKFSRFNLTYSTSTQMIPSCGSVSSCIKSTSISTMFDCLNGLTHGAVHIMIGGLWGQGDLFTSKPHVQFLESLERLLVFKMLWRNGFSRCPTECNIPADAPNKGSNDDCKCSVPEDYTTTYGAKKILQTTGVWSVFSEQFEKMSDDELYDVLKAIEDPGVAGDMFTSGASFDPIFWPVHGLLERIVGLKRIRVSQKLIHNFDETWGYSTKESHYVNGRCDWTNVKHASDLTLPDCDFSSEAYCWGHEEGDVLEFSNFLGTEDEYTNREFYEFIHPWSEDLPYIYDKYDFDYCVEQGFEIA